MTFTRAKMVTTATLAALAGLTAVALSSNAAPHRATPANTTPIVTHQTITVHRTIRKTRTIVESSTGKVLSDHTVTKRSGSN